MSLQRQLFTLFVVILSCFSSCFGMYLEDPLPTNPDETPGHDLRPYNAPILSTIHNQGNKHGFMDWLKSETRSSVILRSRLGQATSTATSPRVVNVDNFGAKGNGGDDTEAFIKAWNAACSSANSVLVVPRKRNYHLKPMTFSGPCKSGVTLKVYGTIKASPSRSDYAADTLHWLVFENIQNFIVQGGGTIDGNGRIWWQNSCKINEKLPCTHAPTAVTFVGCNNLIVANLRIKNAQQMHLTFQRCVDVKALNLWVTAPGNSPNTDGIHVTDTQNIRIQNCVIKTGDDCISIVSGSQNVRATDIKCGPGHGISIGSLGADNSKAYVSNVVVDRATFSGTTNGVRIKSWQGGSGYAKDIIFQNIAMHNVSNPIIIDQNYCDQTRPCPEQDSAVKINTVVYRNIRGTSASEKAVNFDCSKSIPCQGVWLQDVNLAREGDGSVEASCDNVWLTNKGAVSPQCS